jgi:hypothetical protein
MKQRITAVNAAEKKWITSELENARSLTQAMFPSEAGVTLTPELLDRTFKAACTAMGDDNAAANPIINAVGIAFGQHLVDHLNFAWVVASDSGGTELAVLALPGKGDVLILPTNLVAKRWQSKTTDFLVPVYAEIKESLERIGAGRIPEGAVAVKQAKPSFLSRLFGKT